MSFFRAKFNDFLGNRHVRVSSINRRDISVLSPHDEWKKPTRRWKRISLDSDRFVASFFSLSASISIPKSELFFLHFIKIQIKLNLVFLDSSPTRTSSYRVFDSSDIFPFISILSWAVDVEAKPSDTKKKTMTIWKGKHRTDSTKWQKEII